MAKNFSELRDKMSPERQARVAERTKEMLADMEENKVAPYIGYYVLAFVAGFTLGFAIWGLIP